MGGTHQADNEASAKRPRAADPLVECRCDLMTEAEAAAITVPFGEAAERLPAVMAEHGVAVVTGVLDGGERQRLEGLLLEDLRELVREDDLAEPSLREAWQRVQEGGLRQWPDAGLMDFGGRGRFQDRGLPHGRFAWACRAHERVQRVYSILHGTEDLISSCDNAFVANELQEEASVNKSWPHVDQNDHDTRIPCKDWSVFQGILYVWGCDDSTHRSSTVVWPGSHRTAYQDYMSDPIVKERIANNRPHFTLLSGLQPGPVRDRLAAAWDAGCRRVPVPAGGLLLFTSRTTHQGWSGGPRLAQPVCWEPRSRQDVVMRQRKQRLAVLGLPSTHWASLALPHELSDLAPSQPLEGAGADEHHKVRFPLRASVRSVVLKEGASSEELWAKLQTPSWFEPLPKNLAQLLEDSISDDYKPFL